MTNDQRTTDNDTDATLLDQLCANLAGQQRRTTRAIGDPLQMPLTAREFYTDE